MDSREFWSIIIPAVFTSVSTFLLGYLTLRANKQKEEASKQMKETQENNNLLRQVLTDVESVKSVVDDHTTSIDRITRKMDLLGDESVETLRRLLKLDYKKYIERGWWTAAEKAQWQKNFTTYSALGGNHEIAIYNDELMKLPVREG